MAQPLDRNARLPEIGPVDKENGEFWVENPFLMTGGGNNLSAYERNRVFVNVAGEGFLDASYASQADLDSDSRSVVAADFDRDGATDLLVGSVGGGPLRLFLNRFPRSRSVDIELVGVRSNVSAIGSRIVLTVGKQKIVRDLFPTNGGFGQAPAELQVGLGNAERIDRLQIRWPTGEIQELNDLPVDRKITITEGRPDPDVAPIAPVASGV